MGSSRGPRGRDAAFADSVSQAVPQPPRGPYRRLLERAWPYRGRIGGAIVGLIIVAIASMGLAALMKPLVDDGFVHRDPSAMTFIPLALIGLFTIHGAGHFAAQYSLQWVGRRVVFDLRTAVFERLLRLPVGFHDRHASGALVARLVFDVEQIATAVTQAALVIVRDGATVIAMLGWLFWLNWRLTATFVLIVPPSVFLVRTMGKRFRKTSHGVQRAIGEVARLAQQAIEGNRIVKAYGAEAQEAAVFRAAAEENRRFAMRRVATSAIGQPLVQSLAASGLAAVAWLALRTPAVSAGAFVSYVTALTWLLSPAKRLANVTEEVQTGLAAADSVFALLDEPEEPGAIGQPLDSCRGHVAFKGVGFHYSTDGQHALHDVSFSLESGTQLALVGPSGSGKSTIAALLVRFYDPSSGRIEIDGHDLRDLSVASLRAQIAYVGQQPFLFDDTVANNITFGTTQPPDSRAVEEAARAAHVMEFAMNLPLGLHTRLGERGITLSGGQRQRIAIARALYRNARILILDEATAALDAESERLVQDALEGLVRERTTLVIAHRLSTIERADRILVLDQGRVAEEGTHAELLARGALYANLYRTQFRSGASPPA